jgi:hypothetical protein
MVSRVTMLYNPSYLPYNLVGPLRDYYVLELMR